MNIKEFEKLTKDEAFKLWIDYQLTDPLKGTGKLEDAVHGGRCCLGNACHVFFPEERDVYGDTVHYFEEEATLPDIISEKLGIQNEGAIRKDKKSIVDAWVVRNSIVKHEAQKLEYLSTINDATNATHSQIGMLIKELHEQNGFE